MLLGSSPRVRGSQVSLPFRLLFLGIIPAGAGLTGSIPNRCTATWDHPRGCGAHSSYRTRFVPRRGSSPRVRGSRGCHDGIRLGEGIIPAGAGLTMRLPPKKMRSRDHPRGCGAHLSFTSFSNRRMGSSPRVRGSLTDGTDVERDLGIIPAGAGLTHAASEYRACTRDHPRGCGAHTKKSQ